MDSKLTLKLDREVIEKAKVYASNNNKSLSRMVETFLKSIIDKGQSENLSEIEISPYVKSLRTGVSLPEEVDYKQAQRDYLEEKYR